MLYVMVYQISIFTVLDNKDLFCSILFSFIPSLHSFIPPLFSSFHFSQSLFSSLSLLGQMFMCGYRRCRLLGSVRESAHAVVCRINRATVKRADPVSCSRALGRSFSFLLLPSHPYPSIPSSLTTLPLFPLSLPLFCCSNSCSPAEFVLVAELSLPV